MSYENIDRFLIIKQVTKESTADSLGLLYGDVFLKIDGNTITTNQEFSDRVASAKSSGSNTIAITIIRPKEGEKTFEISLDKPIGVSTEDRHVDLESYLANFSVTSAKVNPSDYKFAVYQHPTLGYEAIKKGFSWPGFFFTWIWAFVKKLWGHGIALLIAMMVFNAPMEEAPLLSAILVITLALIIGFNGNAWRTTSILNRGYKLAHYSNSTTPDGAIAEINKGTNVIPVADSIDEYRPRNEEPIENNISTNNSSSPNLADEIKKLSDLKEQGILSDDEFQSAKSKLLSL